MKIKEEIDGKKDKVKIMDIKEDLFRSRPAFRPNSIITKTGRLSKAWCLKNHDDRLGNIDGNAWFGAWYF